MITSIYDLFIYLFYSISIIMDLEMLVERATWWVSPGLLRNSVDLRLWCEDCGGSLVETLSGTAVQLKFDG